MKIAIQLLVLIILAWLTFVAVTFSDPNNVGQWMAQRDIAYEMIWGEWVSDY